MVTWGTCFTSCSANADSAEPERPENKDGGRWNVVWKRGNKLLHEAAAAAGSTFRLFCYRKFLWIIHSFIFLLISDYWLLGFLRNQAELYFLHSGESFCSSLMWKCFHFCKEKLKPVTAALRSAFSLPSSLCLFGWFPEARRLHSRSPCFNLARSRHSPTVYGS